MSVMKNFLSSSVRAMHCFFGVIILLLYSFLKYFCISENDKFDIVVVLYYLAMECPR